jgi:hypothetical protein
VLEPATGAPLGILVALFLVTQLAAVWTVRDRVTPGQRLILWIGPFVVAPFIVAMPLLVVLVWIGLNLVTIGRGI